MRLYTVHLRGGGLLPERDIVLVKEGFSWPALLFGVAWALWYRLWWWAAGLFAFLVLIDVAADRLPFDRALVGVLDAAVAVLFAFVANDLRRHALEGRDFIEADVVAAPDADAAMARFLDARPDILVGMPA